MDKLRVRVRVSSSSCRAARPAYNVGNTADCTCVQTSRNQNAWAKVPAYRLQRIPAVGNGCTCHIREAPPTGSSCR